MIAVEIKKFVVIVLVGSIVSLVPLQALAQVEPRITYDEWCAHLSELYSRLESTPQTNELFLLLSTVVVIIGEPVAELTLSTTALWITILLIMSGPRPKIRP